MYQSNYNNTLIILIILLIISQVPSSNTNALCHQNNKTPIIIIIAPLISHVPRGAQSHPPPLQGGLIVAGGATVRTGRSRTVLDSVEILDRYYCKFKPASTYYQSFIVDGLESEEVSLFLSAGARDRGGAGRGCREDFGRSVAG